MAISGSPPPRQLEGKLAIVTGASRGIGAAICATLASKGCSLVMNFASATSADRTAKLALALESAHAIRAVPAQADMGSVAGPAQLVAATTQAFPGATIDIVVNNAGVLIHQHLTEATPEAFEKLFNVNVRGPMLLVQAAEPHLPRDRSGRIVNISSISSSLGLAGQCVYGATKAALEAMTRTWARELAARATVNAVNPGPVATEMYAATGQDFFDQIRPWNLNTPLAKIRPGVDAEALVQTEGMTGGRAAYEEEIAGVVASVCAPEMGWSTGSVVCANGGMKFVM